MAWDSKQLFTPGQVAVQINYSPRLVTDDFQFEPMTACGVHYWINGRFNGVAYACGDHPVPLHVQVANVSRKHLRIGITYWVPEPQFAG